MTKKISSSEVVEVHEDEGASDERRVYELGYLAVSTLSETQLTELVASMRMALTTREASIISEDVPKELLLAYPMYTRSQEKNIPHEKAFFGSFKFDMLPSKAEDLRKNAISGFTNVIRTLLFTTVREDTRAKVMPEKLREVKATGTITKAAKTEKSSVSESDLDKTVDAIVADIA
jgi:ribosomal protein S6